MSIKPPSINQTDNNPADVVSLLIVFTPFPQSSCISSADLLTLSVGHASLSVAVIAPRVAVQAAGVFSDIVCVVPFVIVAQPEIKHDANIKIFISHPFRSSNKHSKQNCAGPSDFQAAQKMASIDQAQHTQAGIYKSLSFSHLLVNDVAPAP